MKKYKIIFNLQAEKDLIDISSFYKNIDENIRLTFLRNLKRVEIYLSESPEIYTVRYKEVRRVNIEGFPFATFFKIEKNIVAILNIVHHYKDPIFWP